MVRDLNWCLEAHLGENCDDPSLRRVVSQWSVSSFREVSGCSFPVQLGGQNAGYAGELGVEQVKM